MSEKILIVEDSPTQSAVIAALVKQAGFIPVVYNNLPVTVKQLLVIEKPSLVLLDLRLIDSEGRAFADGFQICREIKRSSNAVPVVIITSEDDEEASQWAILQGADAFLQKPFSEEELLQVIKAVLK